MNVRHESCTRARQWVSLRLDQELSEIESRLLRRHLRRCGHCRAFDRAVSRTTLTLRQQRPHEYEVPLHVPARRRSSLRRNGPVWAVAATVLVGLGALAGTSGSGDHAKPHFATISSDPTRPTDVRGLRRQDVETAIASEQTTRFRYMQRPALDD